MDTSKELEIGDLQRGGNPMCKALTGASRESIEDIVGAARRNDPDAWASIVNRYNPLVQSVLRRFRLSEPDRNDVAQDVWLALVTHIDQLREPRALPGWIATVASRACMELFRGRQRAVVVDPLDMAAVLESTFDGVEERLSRSQRHASARAALAELPARQQQLISMLTADPPVSYEEISRVLDMPIGSIGPTRARCLQKLQLGPAVRALAA